MEKREPNTLVFNQPPEIQDLEHIHNELLLILDQLYFSIIRVDLSTDTMYFLQSKEHPDAVYQKMNWTEYLRLSSAPYLPEERTRVLKELSSANLLEQIEQGEDFVASNALYVKNNRLCSMALLAFLRIRDNLPVAYVAVRNSSVDCLQNHIINQYVYHNCDYFCYLDAKHNTCTMFSTSDNGSPMPEAKSTDYMAEQIRYAEKFVVPEDREYVIWEMSLDRVLSQLETKDSHVFYCGVLDPVRGYTRKRLEYRYYERNTQMIFLSRTDVTDIYLAEEEKRKALSEALERAQTDSLSGLLNYNGVLENVSSILDKKVTRAALLFMDLDNFKSVNDTFGHATGDYVLREVSAVLRNVAYGTPLIGRVGGDEFIVFFPNISSMDEVTAYAERVCKGVSSLQYGNKDKPMHMSCSIGIVEAPKDGTHYKMLVKKADEMTYYAKANGKNQYVVYGTV